MCQIHSLRLKFISIITLSLQVSSVLPRAGNLSSVDYLLIHGTADGWMNFTILVTHLHEVLSIASKPQTMLNLVLYICKLYYLMF